jgi:hypothetical protein
MLRRSRMDHLYVVASAVCVRLVGLADWLCGCSHRETTFPRTCQASVSVDGQQSTQAETYVVRLECGRHFAYDWTTMRITRQRAASGRRRLGSGRVSDKSDVTRGERRPPQTVRSGFHGRPKRRAGHGEEDGMVAGFRALRRRRRAIHPVVPARRHSGRKGHLTSQPGSK